RQAALGNDVVASTPEEFGRRIRAELLTWAKVIKAANIKAGGAPDEPRGIGFETFPTKAGIRRTGRRRVPMRRRWPCEGFAEVLMAGPSPQGISPNAICAPDGAGLETAGSTQCVVVLELSASPRAPQWRAHRLPRSPSRHRPPSTR